MIIFDISSVLWLYIIFGSQIYTNLKSVNASKWNDTIFITDVYFFSFIDTRMNSLLQAQHIVFDN